MEHKLEIKIEDYLTIDEMKDIIRDEFAASVAKTLSKETEDKDLCKACTHFWTDFPMPLEQVVPHCELVDNWYGYRNMGDVVSYPCTKCPFNCYLEINHL